jgi:phage/plasmid-like protein (TIGR03299 family)
VGKFPLHASFGEGDDGALDLSVEIPSHFGIFRSDTRAPLGVVGGRYSIVQNSELFGLADVLIQDGHAHYSTAGSLLNGRIVWTLAEMGEFRINRRDQKFDDVIKRYLLWTTRHDGLGKIIGGFTDVRVVCNNTLDAAMGRGIANRIAIKHTRSASARIEEAHKTFDVLIANAAKQTEEFQTMADTAMNVDSFRTFATEFVTSTEADNEVKNMELREKRRDAKVEELIQLFTDGTGNHGNSMWDGYNAVTEWLDHQRKRYHGDDENRKAEKHLDSVLSGRKFADKGVARKLLAR